MYHHQELYNLFAIDFLIFIYLGNKIMNIICAACFSPSQQ